MIEILHETSPSPLAEDQPLPRTEPDRFGLVELLSLLSDDACIPGLRRLLMNRNEERWVRICALRRLSDFEATLPLGELQELLDHRPLWDDTRPDDPFILAELFALFRSPEARQVVRAFVADWTEVERTHLFTSMLNCGSGFSNPDLLNDFYDQWLNKDRLVVEAVTGRERLLNIEVASRTKDRPESRTLLLRYWREGDQELRETLLTDWCENDAEIAEAAAGVEREEQQLAVALRLPETSLLEQLGPEQLVELLEEKIRTADRIIRTDPHYTIGSWWYEASRAFDLLLSWPSGEVDERITSMLCCPDMDQRLRGDLLLLLRKRDPSRTAAVMRTARSDPSFVPLVRRIVAQSSLRTLSEDRDFLLWGVEQQADPVIRYNAVYVLEELGENTPEWRQRLRALTSDADPYLALHAMAALVRRGDGALLPRIEYAARSAGHVCVRAEAVRILGELDAERFLPLLHRLLLVDHEHCGLCPYDYPVFEEGALALARVGTPQALTALLQGYLVAPGLGGRGPLGAYLDWLLGLSDWEGEEAPDLSSGRWQRCRLEQAEHQWCSPLRGIDS